MSGIDIDAAVYDGDTPRAARPRIRQMSRAILSNPFEIHETLPYHHLWRRFFSNLKYVVIDEAHRYTGVFGSNVAQVIRRLSRVAAVYGSKPIFLLASASIANPAEHARNLTGVDCAVVDGDGAPAGDRVVMFVDAARNMTSPYSLTRDIVRDLVRQDVKTLCFTRSRKTAELVAGLASSGGTGLPVAPYRAGYLPAERRRLEREFREGAIKGMVSTSALELGIDIGDLDAVVISGWPGSISGFWQQAGRAGRRNEASAAIFVAFTDILDQYLLNHPDTVLGQAFERATIDLTNGHILAGHMLCAASELPLQISESDSHLYKVARSLSGAGLLRETVAGFVYGGAVRPQEAVRLDRIGDTTVALTDGADGSLLETMDLDRALREAFTGAVYMHGARTWVVRSLDLQDYKAILDRKDVDYHTIAHQDRQVDIIGQSDRSDNVGGSGMQAGLGQMKITHTINKYMIKRYGRVIGTRPLELPERTLQTTGIWIDMPDAPPPGVTDMLGAIHALEHTVVGIAPLVLSCDPDDLAGFSTMMSPQTGRPAMFVYDGYEGGMGLSERAFSDLRGLLGMASDILESCKCEDGCPACCLSPRCGNDNKPMDKAGALVLAGMLCG